MILIAHKTRIALIRIGKILPFVLCALVLLSYCENLYALYNNDLLEFGNFYVLNKPISWSIGAHFAYNIQMLFLIFIISFAIQTCVYNKLACSFLAINLYEKHSLKHMCLTKRHII